MNFAYRAYGNFYETLLNYWKVYPTIIFFAKDTFWSFV